MAKTKAASIDMKILALDRQIKGLKTARHKAEAAVIDLEDRAARRAAREQIDPDKRRGLGR